MSNEINMAEARKAFQMLADQLEKMGGAESIHTLFAYKIALKLGDDMRNGYTTKKAETLRRLQEEAQVAQASGDPFKVAEGFLIEAFLIGWIGIDKLK